MTTINPSEISEIIKSKIENYQNPLETKTTGQVLEIGDGIARIFGLSNVMSSELVEFDDGEGTLGIALNLEEDNGCGGGEREMVCTVSNKKPIRRAPQSWCYCTPLQPALSSRRIQ